MAGRRIVIVICIGSVTEIGITIVIVTGTAIEVETGMGTVTGTGTGTETDHVTVTASRGMTAVTAGMKGGNGSQNENSVQYAKW